jgi:hypothetical protein
MFGIKPEMAATDFACGGKGSHSVAMARARLTRMGGAPSRVDERRKEEAPAREAQERAAEQEEEPPPLRSP